MVEEHTAEPGEAMPAPNAGSLTVGALLAEARAAKGRELADVARETRVPLRHLMAIEADDHGALPALPYALGFVKAFARAVSLDPEAIGARFRAENRLVPHVPTVSSFEPADEARLPSRGLTAVALVALVVVLGGLGLYGAGAFDPSPSPSATERQAPAEAATAAPPPPASQTPVSETPAPQATAPQATATTPPPSSGQVVLTAREDVWLRITDRATGKRAFMGVLSEGQSWTVPDGGPYVMRTGRAGVIEIRVAGQLLPPLGQRNQTLDGVVLSAPALAERFAGQVPLAETPAAAGAAVQPGARPVAAQPALPR